MLIFKEFVFDCAHFLPNVPPDHKCRQVHGHTYRLTIYLEGNTNNHGGWVMDFAEIKKVVSPVIKMLDHKMLNDIEGLENPTAEMMAKWLWKKINPQLPSLKKIKLCETPSSGVIYEGD